MKKLVQQRLFGEPDKFAIRVCVEAQNSHFTAKVCYMIGGFQVCAMGHATDIRQSFAMVVDKINKLQNCVLFGYESQTLFQDYRKLLNTPADQTDFDLLDLFNQISIWFHDSLEGNLIFAIACGDTIKVLCNPGEVEKCWEVRLNVSQFSAVVLSAAEFLEKSA